jgi:DNA-binding CsgD family transcriptional regulator
MSSLCSKDDLILLEQDLESAACTMNNRDYSDYVFKTMGQFLAFDSGWLGLAQLQSKTQVKIEDCFCYKQPVNKIVNNYEKSCIYDPLIPSLLASPRKAINSDEVEDYERYLESDIFTHHAQYFDIHHTISAVSQLGKRYQGLFFSVYSGEATRRFTRQERQFIEEILPKVFSILKGKLGCYRTIQKAILTDCQLEGLKTLTEGEWEIFRQLGESEKPLTAKELGKKCYKSRKRIENQLGSIYAKLYIDGKQNEKKATLLKIAQWLFDSNHRIIDGNQKRVLICS